MLDIGRDKRTLEKFGGEEMKNKGFTSTEVLIVILLICALAFVPVLGIWTDRTLEFWLSYFRHETISVPYWLSLIITIIFNGIAIGINILSELFRLCVV